MSENPSAQSLDAPLLRQIAAVVLPDELSATHKDAAVDAFISWARGYRAGAERSHGYGFTRLRSTGPDPVSSYVEDLRLLEALARGRYSAAFGELTATEQRELITRLVNQAAPGQRELGGVPDETHVVIALLDHFYRSPDATDLCYRATIRRQTCRDLFGHLEPPEPLGRGPAAVLSAPPRSSS